MKRVNDVEPPVDRFNLVWMSFLVLGIGVLMAWNTFIAGFDYFSDRFGGNVTFKISCAFNYPSLLTLLFSVKYAARFSVASRLVTSFALTLAILILTPLFPIMNMSLHVEENVTLAAVFVTGICTGVVFGTVLGFAAQFPGGFVTAAMSGIGAGGVIAGGLRIVTKASLPATHSGDRQSIVIFFALAASVMFLCLLVFFAMQANAFVKYHQTSARAAAGAAGPAIVEEAQPLLDVPPGGESSAPVSVVAVAKQIWRHALAVYLVFTVTLLLFPGVTAQIKGKGNFLDNGWFTTLLIFEFQLFDFIGRSLPQLWVGLSEAALLPAAAVRIVFIPLFFFCAGTVASYRPLAWNGAPFIIMGVFALSNGYVGTLTMIFGPGAVRPAEREIAGIMMSFFLNFGVFTGVNVALACA